MLVKTVMNQGSSEQRPGGKLDFHLPGHGHLTAVGRIVLVALAVSCLTVSLTGCHTTGENLNWYSGPSRATNEIGVVKFLHDDRDLRYVTLETVDGRAIRTGVEGDRLRLGVLNNTTQINLLPGTHTLGLWYTFREWVSLSEFPVTFTCQGGHVYDAYMAAVPSIPVTSKLREFLVGQRQYLAAWIMDEATGEVVAGRRFTKYMIVANSVTSLANNQNGKRISMNTFQPQDTIRFYTKLQVDDLSKQVAPGDVAFNWYAGSQLITEADHDKHSVSFDGVNNTLVSDRPAVALGLGKFKVDLLIHGEQVASQDFTVSP